MRIVSLKKLVEENDVNVVSMYVGEGVGDLKIDVGSPEYREYELYLVKGEFRFSEDPMTRQKTLFTTRPLEKELNLEVKHPEVETEDAPVSEPKEGELNTPVTAVVFHRHNLHSAGRDTRVKYVTLFAHSVLESYQHNFGEAELNDFAVIEVDWANRTVALKSIAEVPAESTDEA